MKIQLLRRSRKDVPSTEDFEIRNPGVIALLVHVTSFTFEGANFQIVGSHGNTILWREINKLPIEFTREDFES